MYLIQILMKIRSKPNPDDSSTNIKTIPRGLGFNKELENPYAYRREDINSLNRALGARFEIPQIQPWEKRVKLKTPDVAYVSPERAIAAKNEQVNQMMQGMQTAQSAQAMVVLLHHLLQVKLMQM